MKTHLRKSRIISQMRCELSVCKLVSILVLILFSQPSRAQESWSDSVPRVMKLAHSCPLKVRDKNGEWANFKDSLPAGKSVIGAINPRRPDLVFFELARDSKFMFAAARSCFEGEQNWNVVAEEERVQGYFEPRVKHDYFFTSLDWISDSAGLAPSNGTGTSTSLKVRIRGACVGGGHEARSDQWFFGGAGCLGLGQAQYRLADVETSAYANGTLAIYGTGRFTAYYDFMSIPYAFGGEAYAGFSKAGFSSPVLNSAITPNFGVTYGVAFAWRFYWDVATITPKIVLHKLKPSNLGLELQIAYLFEGR